ncbi:hypothetical protein BDZ45DRAFT_804035 [Acephala macrosclerotiorum]|nr:hypothetical protein BDZ45DRAFT_804035 [Acephala macrosclerotiorum]
MLVILPYHWSSNFISEEFFEAILSKPDLFAEFATRVWHGVQWELDDTLGAFVDRSQLAIHHTLLAAPSLSEAFTVPPRPSREGYIANALIWPLFLRKSFERRHKSGLKISQDDFAVKKLSIFFPNSSLFILYILPQNLHKRSTNNQRCVISVSDTINLALGLTTIVLAIIAIIVTRKLNVVHRRNSDIENIPLRDVQAPGAPNEAIGEFLASLARVLHHRRA